MTKSSKGYIVLFLLLTIVFASGYAYFANYQPKSIKQVSQVKGYKTSDSNRLNLPYPQGSEKIGVSRTSSGEQLTFQTPKPKKEVSDFYKNILLNKKWKIDSEGIYSDFIISRYEKDGTKVNVIVFDQETPNTSLASIEITNY